MRILFAIALLVMLVPAAGTQDNSAPLIIRPFDDDFLLVYDGGEVASLDHCAPTEGTVYTGFPIVFAPDASQFAYVAAVDGGSNATQIMVCDLGADALVTVAGQETTKLRSLPAWSPDGSQLVWNEADTDGSNLETVVYDFAAQTGTVVYQREEPSAAFLVAGVQWGQPGLALYDVVRGAEDRMQAAVTLIDPAGEDVRQIAVEMADNVVGQWAVDRFVLGAVDNELTVINPASAAVESMVGRLEYYSLSAPDSSIGLTQITAAGEWVVFGPDFNGGLGVNESQYSLTISPDGQKLAIVTFENYPFGGKAYILDQFDGFPYTGTPVPGMDSAGYSQPGALYVFWGPVGLRIQES